MTNARANSMATGPMLNKPPRRNKVPCGVCQGAIVDGKDEALLCEGDCGLWFHRGCASIPPCRYKELSNTEEPFICLSCNNVQLKREIVLLKRELKDMAELRDKYSTLETEMSSLRVAIDALKGTKILSQPRDRAALSNKQPKRSYAKAAKAARTHQVPACSPATTKLHSAVSSQPTSSIAGSENPSANSQTGSKVKVVGARRIWNTLPTVMFCESYCNYDF